MQVEFSNVVILNKGDLVNETQTTDIIEKIQILNPNAKVVKTVQSKVNVLDILNTNLYEENQTKEEYWMMATKVDMEQKKNENLLDCCVEAIKIEGKKCCKSKNENLLDSGLSQVNNYYSLQYSNLISRGGSVVSLGELLFSAQVHLGVMADKTGVSRHQSRFGISSFVFRARRPFHPARLTERFIAPFFCQTEEGEIVDDLQKLQSESAVKQIRRTKTFGEILRSKGFIWLATAHKIMGSWQQAGSAARLAAENPWMCQVRDAWQDSAAAPNILKDMLQPGGEEEYLYGDRRQELVFIGQRMKHKFIQDTLDQCLLTDEEMALGPVKWEQSMENGDKIKLMEKFWTQDSTSMERYWDQHSIKAKTLIFDLD